MKFYCREEGCSNKITGYSGCTALQNIEECPKYKKKTTARVIVTYRCNRSCQGCCNGHDNDIKKIKDFNELLKYDEIVITGGEPMLIKDKLFNFLLSLRDNGFKGKIFMYTAFWNPGIYSNEILQMLDGITFTVHAESTSKDIFAFKELSIVLWSKHRMKNRLFIDSRIWNKFEKFQRRFSMWDEVRKLEWKDKCEPADHEELLKFLL